MLAPEIRGVAAFPITEIIVAPILNHSDIVENAYAIVQAEGPARLTARTLASKLFVAPATLYNYVESMDAVLGLVEERILDDIAAATGTADSNEQMRDIVMWLRNHRGEAQLVLDPTRAHPSLSSSTLMQMVGDRGWLTEDSLEDFRGILAMMSTIVDEASIAEISTWLPSLSQCMRDLAAGSDPKPLNVPDPLADALDVVAKDTSVSDAERTARTASLELISGGEEWSFQGMAKATGLSVGKLHRLASRRHHLARFASDWINGGLIAATRENADPVDAISACAPMFVNSGLSAAAMSDLWSLPELSFLDPLVDAAKEVKPQRSNFPADVAVAAPLGVLISRLTRATSDDEKQAAGAAAAQFARSTFGAI